MINKETKQIIQRAFSEDKIRKDVTTQLTIPKDKQGKAIIVAQEEGIFCGKELVTYIFKKVDKQLSVKTFLKDSTKVYAGKKVITVSGILQSIMQAERIALNFLSLLSGVATATNLFVQQVKGTKVIIKDTRKTTPGLRELEKYAVLAGGGRNHRYNLAEGIIIKDNHLKAAKIVNKKNKINHPCLAKCLQRMRKKTSFPLEIEVETFNEFKQILEHQPDIIMLDNFSRKDLIRAVKYRNKNYSKIKLEASGRINLKNVRSIAQTGVDFISIGSITHSPKALDFSLELL